MSKRNHGISWIHAGLVGGILSIALLAFASGRKVSIPISSNLQLTNGSDTPVTYSLVCYGSGNGLPVGGTNTYTLGARASTNYYYGSSFAGCNASNYSYWQATDNKAGLCNAPTTFANAASSCGSGYTVCSMSEYTSRNPYTGYSAWVSQPAGYSNWTHGYGTATNAFTATDNVAYIPYSVCNDGVNNIASCGGYPASSTLAVACCAPANISVGIGSVQSCDVTVQGTGGFLQSSNWKGNTPF